MDGEVPEYMEDSCLEDEVTFLLRLRPSPTPPIRRRRLSGSYKPTISVINNGSSMGGWDVCIESGEGVAPMVPPRKSSQNLTRKSDIGRKHLINATEQNKTFAPPLPPRLQPSAPPPEQEERVQIYANPRYSFRWVVLG